MLDEQHELEMPSLPMQAGLSIVWAGGARTDRPGLSEKILECGGCDSVYCQNCGTGLNSPSDPNLVTVHAMYSLKPPVRTVEKRKHSRIPVRSPRACVKTEQGASVIVDVINISRGGICFTSSAEFDPETPVSIAMHYVEGGQNIFQDGRIVRVQHRPSATLPGEYGLEF